jgi:3-oxoacyl-[acyl-carrier-protein] synthase-1
MGLGEGLEKATVDAEDVPLRADGMVQAIRSALTEAHCGLGDLDFRIADVSGEQYGFKEAALALTRILRQRKRCSISGIPRTALGRSALPSGPSC